MHGNTKIKFQFSCKFRPVGVELFHADRRTDMTKLIVKNRTLVRALGLCTGHTAHRGSRSTVLRFHDHGTRSGWKGQRHATAALPTRNTRYLLHRSLGGPQGRSGTGAENLAPTRFRSPDRPVRSQSLYRLSYRAHKANSSFRKFWESV